MLASIDMQDIQCYSSMTIFHYIVFRFYHQRILFRSEDFSSTSKYVYVRMRMCMCIRHGKDATLSQFFMRCMISVQNYPFPRLVAVPSLKSLVYAIIY